MHSSYRTLLLGFGCLISCGGAPEQTQAPPPAPTVTCSDATPCALVDGVAATGQITTVGQVDVYSLHAPATGARTILKLSLSNSTQVSPVKLVALLENSSGSSVLTTLGPQSGTGQQKLTGFFLIPAGSDDRILVRDSANTHADAINGYLLTAALLPDPDLGEPDDNPAQARPLALSATTASATGSIASAGDIDLCSFSVPAGGALVHWTVNQAVSSGSVQLRARLLARSAANPNLLSAASSVVESDAKGPGAALAVDLVRALPGGDYLIALDDLSGKQGDPGSQWSTAIALQADPDPNEQPSRNDTAQTATALTLDTSLRAAIGSQGDVDWYEVALPATSTAQVLELKLDPLQINQDLELAWAVGALLTAPVNGCAQSCGPSAFCVAGDCAYKEHANHHFQRGETAAQSVRIRHLGAAETVRIVVEDFGDLAWSTKAYAISATLGPDPDANELAVLNDSRDASTPVAYVQTGDAGVSFAAQGAIEAWDAIDGLNTFETAADVDWYQLQLPPRVLAPPCPWPDAGFSDGGLPDGGLCTAQTPDAGPVYYPRPDYGVALHWQNPADGAYLLGLQGTVALDAGTACLFSLDQSLGHALDAGGYSYGDRPADLCFCIPGREADQLWVKLEAAHRSAEPAPAVYSNLPYSFELDLTPNGLQPACDGGCAGPVRPSSCPGD